MNLIEEACDRFLSATRADATPENQQATLYFIPRLIERIEALEAALEPFEQAYQREATIRNLPGGAYENAARVLRKGAEHDE